MEVSPVSLTSVSDFDDFLTVIKKKVKNEIEKLFTFELEKSRKIALESYGVGVSLSTSKSVNKQNLIAATLIVATLV